MGKYNLEDWEFDFYQDSIQVAKESEALEALYKVMEEIESK